MPSLKTPPWRRGVVPHLHRQGHPSLLPVRRAAGDLPPLPTLAGRAQQGAKENSSFAYPRVIAAHADSVLLQLTDPPRIDYFVYKAGSGGPPSLSLLPQSTDISASGLLGIKWRRCAAEWREEVRRLGLASIPAPYPPRSAIYRDDGDGDGGDMQPSTNTRGEAATQLASTWAPYPPRSAIYRDDGDDDGGDMRPRTNTRGEASSTTSAEAALALSFSARGKRLGFAPKESGETRHLFFPLYVWIRGWIRYLAWRATLFSKIQREAGGLRRTVGSGMGSPCWFRGASNFVLIIWCNGNKFYNYTLMCSSSIPTKSNAAVGIMRKRGSALICDAWKETLSMAGCMLSEMSTSKSGIKTNSSAAGPQPSRWPLEFKKKQQEIIELGHTCSIFLGYNT
ncbi:uncharacterized protein LOC124650202 [Lolium rigidum]|uniref:uncharacterized protein LOC124650202 n=1 Tax=Lolium rigidum TaxID=89674 RepID=UPI001F5D6515|nr:uncharacterized protein LOC124650202 [Lolium rigidum]